jgi:secondary thiamine-phosphate synthase enzyme
MPGVTETFTIATNEPEQPFDITENVRDVVKRADLDRGTCHVMVLHTTCAIVVNETADPNIGRDVIRAVGELVPTRNDWLHDQRDDNAHSHIKASLLGSAKAIPIVDGELLLGTWQAIWMLEFDGPRERKVAVHLVEG